MHALRWEEHIPSNLDDNMELRKKLKDRNDTKITFKGLLAKMKGDSTPNFHRPFVLYTISKYLMLDDLMDNMKNYVNGEVILEGNLPVLQTWYYEKFTVHQLDYSISYGSRLRLLIQNWSKEKEKNVDNIIQNNYLGVGEYVEDLMKPFIPTQDGTLAKLKTGAQIMRHDEPIDTRDDQLVYIERVADVAKLERDGRIEKCYEDSLAGIPGTTQGTSYPKHDMVRGMEAYLSAAMRINGIESNAWEEINVTQCPLRNIIVPKGDESALYMLKNIQLFTGEKPRMQYDQAYIEKFRRELPIVLDDSPYNKLK
ncbi:hypothetical protein D1007_24849 [Hordeum vulgare]|nr:hypothetical protein D1007_24849 [Hordeum vulgare]